MSDSMGFGRFGQGFGMPGALTPPAMPDLGALAQLHQRNMETLMQVNAVMLGGVQALAQRQMQIMQESVAEMTGAMQGLAAAPQDMTQPMAAAQAACAKSAAQLSELAGMVQKTGTEAAALLERRFTAAMAEVGALAPKT